MPGRKIRSWRGAWRFLREAVSAVGWGRLLIWSAVAALPVAAATNTLWLMIQTAVPPRMASSLELVPYFAGMFLATVVGQVLGRYAGLQRELPKMKAGYRSWFRDNPLAELNGILWNTGTEDQAMGFRGSVRGETSDTAVRYLDEERTMLLTIVGRNLESVLKLFHIPGMPLSSQGGFGSQPNDENLLSLARGLRKAGWGQVELRPSSEWLLHSMLPFSVVGSLLLLAVMLLLSALTPLSKLLAAAADEHGFLFNALAVQGPFDFVFIALSMLYSAGRASSVVAAAMPKGLRSGELEKSLTEASDPFERLRLLLGALPEADRKELLEATRDALREALQEYKAYSGTGISQR
jgi:hypothetical protein